MDELEEMAAERGAVKVLISHWAALDAADYPAIAAGFAGDGVWHRQGKELKGPAMVRQAMAERAKGARTRHIITNVLSTVTSETEVEADFYMTVYSHHAETETPAPVPMDLPNTVGHAHAKMRRDGARWKIVYLKSAPTFQRK